MSLTPQRQQPSYFGAGEGSGRKFATGLTESARKRRGGSPEVVKGVVDEQLLFGLEDRRRVHGDNDNGNGNENVVENSLLTLSGRKVFAFDSLVAREVRKKHRLRDKDKDNKDCSDNNESNSESDPEPETDKTPLTPSRNNTNNAAPVSALRQSRTQSSAKKNVAFVPPLGSSTPSKSVLRNPLARNNMRSSTIAASTAAALPPLAPSSKPSSKPQSTTATPERRTTRSATGSIPASAAATPKTPKTPKGRTPDAKLAARQRLKETVSVSDSETDEDDIESDDEEFGSDHDEDEDDDAPNFDADAVNAIEGDNEDRAVAPSRFGHKESDYDRDIKRRGKTRADVEDYFVETGTKGKKKNLTSNNTLSSLPVLTQAEFRASLENMPFKHKRERDQLSELIPTRFKQYDFELSQGFNLILYGYGSKRSVLSRFKAQYCTNVPVLTLNGYMPVVNLTADLLGKLSIGLLGKDASKSLGPASTQINNIAAYFQNPARTHSHMYLLINSIDGPAMRLPKQQLLLQTLIQSVPRGTVRIIATIDHINAPLLWDRQAADVFHWLWKDSTTYEEYFVETGYEGFVMVEAEARKGANGAVHVLRSLNSNARKMFKILADSQLETAAAATGRSGGDDNEPSRKKRRVGQADDGEDEDDEAAKAPTSTATTNSSSVGLAYYKFLNSCIENFCVNSQDNFKAQLAEFRDHRIILSRRGFQGEEILYIPFDKSVLETLLSQITF
ncbi:UNVERIFIED_CONTAM: Origin recognition complex subunit 2 [Siphonaria sp. JEL0065]|nr:Origin recognition complex subunit 2 [Siphonaria sp. JEL0065]